MSRSNGSYHHGNLAAELETAAMALLHERGAAALSLREVARRAGVSHNAPYHHFGDRAALLARVAVQSMAELLAAQEDAVAAASDPRAALVAQGTAYVEYAVDHPHAFAAVFDPQICNPGAPSPAMAELVTRNEDLLRRLAGDVWDTESAHLLSASLWSTVHGMATLVSAGHLPTDVVCPALQALLPPEEPGRHTA